MNDEYAGLDDVKGEIEYLRKHYDTVVRRTSDKYTFYLKKGRITKLLKSNHDIKARITEAIDQINKDPKRLKQALKELNLLKLNDSSYNWLFQPIKVRKDNLLDANTITLELLEALMNSSIVHIQGLIKDIYKDLNEHKKATRYKAVLQLGMLDGIRQKLVIAREEISDYNAVDFTVKKNDITIDK